MSHVDEIEKAVEDLSPEDLAAFRRWFAEYDSAAWDRQIEADALEGRFDALADEALGDVAAGRVQKL